MAPVRTYMAQAAVKAAIHASNHTFPWDVCSQHINYVQYLPTMVPIYQQLLKAGIRVMVYSGDADSCVNMFGTQKCVQAIGETQQRDWTPWYVVDPQGYTQTAGYNILYTNVRIVDVLSLCPLMDLHRTSLL